MPPPSLLTRARLSGRRRLSMGCRAASGARGSALSHAGSGGKRIRQTSPAYAAAGGHGRRRRRKHPSQSPSFFFPEAAQGRNNGGWSTVQRMASDLRLQAPRAFSITTNTGSSPGLSLCKGTEPHQHALSCRLLDAHNSS